MHPSRRSLLGGSLATLVGASLLRGGTARAEGVAKRLCVFYSPNGTVHDYWRPSGSGASYTLDSPMLSPLAGWEDRLLVLDGLDFHGADNHEPGMGAMLTAGGGTSVDQVIADQIGGDTPFRSIELGVQTSAWGGSTQTRISYRDGSFLTPDDNPKNAWSRLFGGLGDEALLERREAVLDLVGAELGALNGRVEAPDLARLDTHAGALGEVRKGLSGGSCESVASPGTISHYDNDAFPDVTAAQIELAVQALACEMTRVVSIQLSHTISPTVFSWVGESSGHHTLSHASDAAGEAGFARCQAWCAEQFESLLTQLDAQGLLEDTLVLWCTEMGDPRAHVCTDVPWILAGGNGFFDLGRYLALGSEPHDRVLTSMCNAFGLDHTDFAGRGNPALEELR